MLGFLPARSRLEISKRLQQFIYCAGIPTVCRGSGEWGRVKRFISRGQLVSSSRTFVAKREKVIIVENIAGGPLRKGGFAQLSLYSFHEWSFSIMPWPAPIADDVRCCLAGGCGGRPWSCLWVECHSGVSASQWRKWVWMCPDAMRDGWAMPVHVSSLWIQCWWHLEAGATAPAGRLTQSAAALAHSGAAGRQSPWQPGSLPGSSPPGSWSPGDRCSDTSPPSSHPGREKRHSRQHMSLPL